MKYYSIFFIKKLMQSWGTFSNTVVKKISKILSSATLIVIEP